MKSKVKSSFLCFFTLLLFLIGAIPVSAAESSQTVGEAQGFIDSIAAYQQKIAGYSSIQEWINGTLAKNAGSSSEWYVIALSQYGDYDFSSYEKALLTYLDDNEAASASSRQKYALALIACGSTDAYIYDTINDSIGQQGVMSRIFGLHLLNNGYTSNNYSLSAVKQELLSLQLSDGGWAVTGSNGDVDVTAMAIQALAPYYNSDSSVKSAVDNALTFLSCQQKEKGDYASYGVNNPESTAQVLVALSSLGIDCETDSRFIKNGNTLLDGIALYLLSDGSFCHNQGGSSNGTATVQVFYSMVSYLRMKNGQSSLYVLDNRNPSGLEIPEDTTSQEPDTSTLTESADNADSTTRTDKNSGSGYKVWACIAIAVTAGGVCAVLYIRKKRNTRNFILVGVIAAVAVVFVLVTNFQSTESYYNQAGGVKSDSIGTVSITIRCDTITDRTADHIPDDGMLLDLTEVEIEDGDTVYDVLVNVTAKNKIHLETAGSGAAPYVQGIGNIYEFDFGDLSGWMYFVNGESPSVSCGEYILKTSDNIEWLYTCNLGEDLNQ